MAPSGTATAAPSRRHAVPAHGSPDTSRRWGRGAADGAGATTPAIRRIPLRVVPSRHRRRSDDRPGTREPARTGAGPSTSSPSAWCSGPSWPSWSARRCWPTGRSVSPPSSSSSRSNRAAIARASSPWPSCETPARSSVPRRASCTWCGPTRSSNFPYVSLSTPLPTPKVTPAPESPPAPATSGTSATGGGVSGTGTAGTGASGGAGAASAAASGSSGTSTTTATSTP